jgi:hypothetical protein
MFTRAPGPACVNGCVRGEPQAGHAMRAGGVGFAAGSASVAAASGSVPSSLIQLDHSTPSLPHANAITSVSIPTSWPSDWPMPWPPDSIRSRMGSWDDVAA